MVIRVGGAGGDTLVGTSDADILQGGEGGDLLIGGIGQDILAGEEGNDTLEGGRGADRLNGGAGADRFRYAAALDLAGDTIIGFASQDTIDLSSSGLTYAATGFSGAGNEFMLVRDATRATLWTILVDRDGDGVGDIAATVNLAVTGGGLGVLDVTAPGIVQVLKGEFLEGDGGDNTLLGTSRADIIQGGDGADSLLGDAGNDDLLGDAGNDVLVGGGGSDELTGGTGADRFTWRSHLDFGDERIGDFGVGDRIVLSALTNLRFIGTAEFGGRPGEMRMIPAAGSLASDLVLEFDFDGDALADGVITLDSVSAIEPVVDGWRVFQRVTNMRRIGTDDADLIVTRGGRDTIAGDEGNDSVGAGAGRDLLAGEGGNDSLDGGADADRLDGGEGNDTLVGGGGVDTLVGGTGFDTFRYVSLVDLLNDDPSLRELIEGALRGDRLDFSDIPGLTWIGSDEFGDGIGVELRQASALEIRLRVTAADGTQEFGGIVFDTPVALAQTAPGSRVLRVTAPFDTVLSAGADTFVGGETNETVRGAGGNDSILGNAGDDSLLGGTGADTLLGGAGNDVLQGGLGADLLRANDTLDEGGELDVYVFASLAELGLGAAADVIVGGIAGDLISFSLIDWSDDPGDQAFTLVTDFTAAGQIRYTRGSGLNAGRIQLNTDDDLDADYEVLGALGTFFALTDEQILL